MEESNLTASAIISFAERLEDDSSRFYEKLAEKFKEDRKTFLSFVKESEKNRLLVRRTYQETITDALEACFSFKDLNLDDYLVEVTLPENASYYHALKIAVDLEKKASAFYSDVAERSSSLLATIPGAFRKAAENRKSRKIKLESLLANPTD